MERYDARDFLTTTRLCGASFSRNEQTILISSDASGVFNAYAVSISDATIKQRTFSQAANIFPVSYARDDDSILFLREEEKDERVHLYISEIQGHEQDLTPGASVGTRFHGWNPDGRSFYCTCHGPGRQFFDLYRVSADTFERKLLCNLPLEFVYNGISADEKFLVIGKLHNSRHSDVFLYCLATGELKNVTAGCGRARFTFATFDPRGRYLYYLTDLNSQFAYLERCELTSGKSELVEAADGDILYTHFSRNGRYRVTGINENTETKIRISEEATGRPVDLPRFPRGEITGVTISDSERLLAFYVDGECAPNDLHIFDFDTRQVTKLTSSLGRRINSSDLVEAIDIRFKSFDGLEIPSLLWVPKRASRNNRLPALVWAHGGPGDQTRRGYHGLIQYLVNHDYVVLAVNFRGSQGYGKSFRSADDRKHGREPLWDCLEAKKYLATLPYVDPSKIGIIGESYGGYMVLAALAFHPEEFAVGVDMFGVSNWLRMLETLPSHSQAMAEFLFTKIGNPASDAEMLKEISPLFQAHRINKPLLVLHGAKDLGVAREQSDEMVAAIESSGGPVEYLLFADEGHGFSKKHNQIRAFEETLSFLDRYLRQQGSRSAITATTQDDRLQNQER